MSASASAAPGSPARGRSSPGRGRAPAAPPATRRHPRRSCARARSSRVPDWQEAERTAPPGPAKPASSRSPSPPSRRASPWNRRASRRVREDRSSSSQTCASPDRHAAAEPPGHKQPPCPYARRARRTACTGPPFQPPVPIGAGKGLIGGNSRSRAPEAMLPRTLRGAREAPGPTVNRALPHQGVADLNASSVPPSCPSFMHKGRPNAGGQL